MDWTDYIRFLAALLFVLALMGGFSLILRRTGLAAGYSGPARKRLKISETLVLDGRRKAVLLRRDDREHLVILGPNGETLVESDIDAPKTDQTPEDDDTIKPL